MWSALAAAVETAAQQQAASAAKDALDAHQSAIRALEAAPSDAQLAARNGARQQFVVAVDALSELLAEGGAAAHRAKAVDEAASALRLALAALRDHDAPSSGAGEGAEPEHMSLSLLQPSLVASTFDMVTNPKPRLRPLSSRTTVASRTSPACSKISVSHSSSTA